MPQWAVTVLAVCVLVATCGLSFSWGRSSVAVDCERYGASVTEGRRITCTVAPGAQ